MENQENLITPLFEKIKDYGETSYELIKLKTIEKTIRLFSGLVTQMIIILVFGFFLLFSSVALAIWLGRLCSEMYLGFFYVGLGYAFFGGLLVLFFRKALKRRIADILVENTLH